MGGTNNMKEFLNKIRNRSIIIAILGILFSILLMTNPIKSITTFAVILGILCFTQGIWCLFDYINEDRELRLYNMGLLEGFLLMSVGLLTVLSPDNAISTIAVIAGVWIILENLIKIHFTMNYKNDIKGQGWIILFSTLCIILGIYVIGHPIISVISATKVAGLVLLCSEIYNLIATVVVFSRAKKCLDE